MIVYFHVCVDFHSPRHELSSVSCLSSLHPSLPLAVPLKSIAVEVSVQGHVATVSSTLQYENQEESPLEAIFVFPLPGEAAVCRFSAKIGQTEVVAEVQEKQKVRGDDKSTLRQKQQCRSTKV